MLLLIPISNFYTPNPSWILPFIQRHFFVFLNWKEHPHSSSSLREGIHCNSPKKENVTAPFCIMGRSVQVTPELWDISFNSLCIEKYNLFFHSRKLSLYMGLPLKNIQKLPLVHNAAAWAILDAQRRAHVTPLLCNLTLGASLLPGSIQGISYDL